MQIFLSMSQCVLKRITYELRVPGRGPGGGGQIHTTYTSGHPQRGREWNERKQKEPVLSVAWVEVQFCDEGEKGGSGVARDPMVVLCVYVCVLGGGGGGGPPTTQEPTEKQRD